MTAAVTQCSAFTVYIDNFVLQAKNTAEVKTSCMQTTRGKKLPMHAHVPIPSSNFCHQKSHLLS